MPEDCETKKKDGVDYSWSDYLDKICTIIILRHADANLILSFNIKDVEHDRRAAKHSHILNVYPKAWRHIFRRCRVQQSHG